MTDIIEQAFEAGRAAAKYEMAELARIRETFPNAVAAATGLTGKGEISRAGVAQQFSNFVSAIDGAGGLGGTAPKKRRGRVAKINMATAKAPKEPKAPKVARGVKRASTGPRTKGVKEAISSMIGDSPNGVTVADIVDRLGFKETSVRATLMGLKKAGIVSQAGKVWMPAAGQSPSSLSSNSETAHADAANTF